MYIGITTNLIEGDVQWKIKNMKTYQCNSRGGGWNRHKDQYFDVSAWEGNIYKSLRSGDIVNIEWNHQSTEESLFSLSIAENEEIEKYYIDEGILDCARIHCRLGIGIYNKDDTMTLISFSCNSLHIGLHIYDKIWKETLKLMEWLEEAVRLQGDAITILIRNGFDSFEGIRELTRDDLKIIGINKHTQQDKILRYAKLIQ